MVFGRWVVRAAMCLAMVTATIGTDGGTPARAHGIWAHIHVTGWAVENLPPGELRSFLASDPEVFDALLFGAAFTDSGYWPQSGTLADKARAYGEHTHWEPFVSDYIAWIRANDPPPWTTLESKKRVAFLLGCAAHGLQDEVFDSLFLFQTMEHDGQGQSTADPASDGFLAHDGLIRFIPSEYLPMDVLLDVYSGLSEGITEDVIRDAVGVMTFLYVNDGAGPEIALTRYDQGSQLLPWMGAHYLDPAIPGSLRAEIRPTAAYLQALWKRLQGTWNPASDWVVATYPEAPRRLLGHQSGSPDAWVTAIFGEGTNFDAVTATWTADATAADVGFSLANTRWGNQWTRLVRLQPAGDLTPGGWYTVGLPGGVGLRGGGEVPATGGWMTSFQVGCDGDDPALCPPQALTAASIDGPGLFDPPGPEPKPEAGPEPGPEPGPDAVDPVDTAADVGQATIGSGGGGCAGGRLGGGTEFALVLAALALVLAATARARRRRTTSRQRAGRGWSTPRRRS